MMNEQAQVMDALSMNSICRLKEMRGHKVELSDIAFLAPKKYVNSKLSEIGFAVNELRNHYDPVICLPRFATIPLCGGVGNSIM